MDFTPKNKKLIPLSKVVAASIIDTYGNIGQTEQRHTHFAARGLKKLYIESLPNLRHKVLLHVNPNTHTATLPDDFDRESMVAVYDSSTGRKIALKLNPDITDTSNITDIPYEAKCPKCSQDKSICNDLSVTQEVNLVVINGTTYEESVVKKLYPNGDYCLEKTTPFISITGSTSPITEVRAIGHITISDIGHVGDSVSVNVPDPQGNIVFGSYVRTLADTNVNILATNLAAALTANAVAAGYAISVLENIIAITAQAGTGATMDTIPINLVFSSSTRYKTRFFYNNSGYVNNLVTNAMSSILTPDVVWAIDGYNSGANIVNLVFNDFPSSPATAFVVGDFSEYVIPAGVTIDSVVWHDPADGGNGKYTVALHYTANADKDYLLRIPVYVSVFRINGVEPNYQQTTIVDSYVRWEAVNFDSIYNLGYECLKDLEVHLIFNNWPKPVGSTGIFSADYTIPAGVTIDSAIVNAGGASYTVTLHYTSDTNHIYNFTSI